MLGRRNLLQTIKYVKTTAGSGDPRRVFGGLWRVLRECVAYSASPMSFLRHLLWATVRGHYSGLE